MSDYQVWLVASEYDGEEVPYQMVGNTSSEELAQAFKDAAERTGYKAIVIRSR